MRNKSPKCPAIQQLFGKLLPSCLNTRHRVPNHAITESGQVSNYATKKPTPEHPTAGTDVEVRVYPDRGKRLGPVFSFVEKAQDYLSSR